MMRMCHVILHLAMGVFLLAAPGFCRPEGAPTTACVTMRPGHGAQSGEPVPYAITIGALTYRPGQHITVTVSVRDGARYRGILMQMREVGGGIEPIGTWTNVAENHRTLTCTNQRDSITHENTMEKGTSVFTWIAPRRAGYRRLQVRATIASGFGNWWMGITSDRISGVSPSPSIPVYVVLMAAILSTFLPRLSA